MIIVLLAWLAATAIMIVVLFVASADVPPPVVQAPVAHPRASMRLVFVTVHDHRVVLDGLLELDPQSVGVPTAWSFASPEQPVLAAATLHVLETWADDGTPVVIDLSKIATPHPSVGFTGGDVHLRLSVLPRGVREQL